MYTSIYFDHFIYGTFIKTDFQKPLELFFFSSFCLHHNVVSLIFDVKGAHLWFFCVVSLSDWPVRLVINIPYSTHHPLSLSLSHHTAPVSPSRLCPRRVYLGKKSLGGSKRFH